MPMMMVQFCFSAGAPTEAELMPQFQAYRGPGRGDFDSVEVVADTVTVTSMDIITLVYVAKVCQDLRGAAVRLGTGELGTVAIPAWAERPWTEHSWLGRLKIRFGRIPFAVQPNR